MMDYQMIKKHKKSKRARMLYYAKKLYALDYERSEKIDAMLEYAVF